MTQHATDDTLTGPVTGPQQPVAVVPSHGNGKLLTGGKPGPRGPYNKAAKNKLMRQMTGELLRQIAEGLSAKDSEIKAQVKAGKPRALETATRIMESVHDRAYGKPMLANQLADGDADGAQGANVKVVQIGSVSITF